jgi:hypothetical protein
MNAIHSFLSKNLWKMATFYVATWYLSFKTNVVEI